MTKESRFYKRSQLKIGDNTKRPIEKYIEGDDNSTSLVFKSSKVPVKRLTVGINGMDFKYTPSTSVYDIEYSPVISLDCSISRIQKITLTDNLFIKEINNYEENVEYTLIVSQNEIGGNEILFDKSIKYKILGNLNIESNNISAIRIIKILDYFYFKIENNILLPTGEIKFTIDTTLGFNAGATFTLPLKQYSYNYDPVNDEYLQNETLNYNFTVDWGDGNTNNITSWDDTNKNHNYDADGEYIINISGLCEGFGFIDNQYDYNYMSGDYEKVISIQNLSYVGLKECDSMFYECSNLTSIEQSTNDWFKDVTVLSNILSNCSSLTSIDVSNWNVSSVNSMQQMFQSCTSLISLDVSGWNVSNVNNMTGMFSNCTSLTSIDVSNWDVSSVTNMYSMFSKCTSLTSIDVSNWDVSSVNSMQFMFNDCTSLTSLDVSGWNVSKVTEMYNMFKSCTSLITLDVSGWNVSNVNNMTGMFGDCTSLTSLDVSSWDISNITNMNAMFFGVTLDTTSYDNLLVGWSTLSAGETKIPTNITFDAGGSKFTSVGEAAKTILTGTYNWSISDQGLQV